MTGREKIRAGLSVQGTEEFAAVVPYVGILLRDHIRDVTDGPWWGYASPDVEEQARWYEAAYRRLGLDWLELPRCRPAEESKHLHIEEKDGDPWLVDTRGGSRRRIEPPAVGGWPGSSKDLAPPQHPPETIEEVDERLPPPGTHSAQISFSLGTGDLADALLERLPELLPMGQVGSPLWSTFCLWGFEGMMTRVAERPDLVRHACERYTEYALRAVEEAADLGAEGIWIEECMTDMVSPRAYRNLNLPCLRLVTERIRQRGIASILYYCGDPKGKWDLLLDSGADALALEEGKKGFAIDIEDVVERVGGRCAVLGNLDAIGVLEKGIEAELRSEIGRQLRAGKRNNGRFVASLGSPVTPGTPVSRARLFCEMVREIGRHI